MMKLASQGAKDIAAVRMAVESKYMVGSQEGDIVGLLSRNG
jgi:hypothetical protein